MDPLAEFPRSDVMVQPDEVIDAGPDPRPPFNVREGLRRRARYRRAYGRAVLLRTVDPPESDRLVREALSIAASASYWLEGTEHFVRVHHDIHEMGRFAREHHPSGCRLHLGDEQYEHRCPVALSHKRFGFSPGLVIRRFACSLCGEDVADCPHRPGRLYRVRGGAAASRTGRCRVCNRADCDHSEVHSYLTTMSVTPDGPIEMQELSLVARPVQPDARLTSIPVPFDELQLQLGPGFDRGMRVDCNRCLEGCSGFDYLPREPA